MRFAGIDPGVSGGLAMIDPQDDITGTDEMIEFYPMPPNPDDLKRIIKRWFDYECVVCLEQVSGFQGVAHPGSHMFEFGRNVGLIEGIVTGLAHYEAIQYVRPQAWQKHHNVVPKKKSETDYWWKKRLRGYAERAFPSLLVTDKTADALLIMKYCHDVYGEGK